ncbi:hypothetical protein G6F59_018968 [Rhizopus arrhizus]|nr:hypothetical protein G6F59_018968 [Rhizopus arrhizus]
MAVAVSARAWASVAPFANSGRPQPLGGSGAYSSTSSIRRAVSAPAHCATITKPKSIPPVKPPPLAP